ncbi:phosphodiesterase [Kordiimonas sediminis]|uniref:Phosphodiesterase n=1 Tax=Kordiimonas sediminis TaxID=1735581 RepID=A0A919AWL4_9PROT|nr:glycerophosphodiester phosphodiesterase family protein [Kordiimonas sediminis]GHF29854.1 phosphodiesterase [Kordiimonas sediminis]
MAARKQTRHIPWLGNLDIAHRGLFDRTEGREENTLSAITYAADKGYAVEFDVVLTRDETVIVFHDATLDRLTDGKGRVDTVDFADLAHTPTKLNGEPIPCLADVLSAVAGRVPIYLEIKSARKYDPTRLCREVYRLLADYKGDVCIMSFDPRAVRWFRKNAPEIVRGLVIEDKTLQKTSSRLMLRYAIRRNTPDFLSVDISSLPHPYYTRWRKTGKKLITWTVRTKEQEVLGRQHTDALTFEKPAVLS